MTAKTTTEIKDIIAFWREHFNIDGTVKILFRDFQAEDVVALITERTKTDILITMDFSQKPNKERVFLHEYLEEHPELLVEIPADLPNDLAMEWEQKKEDFIDDIADILKRFRKNDKKRTLEK